MRTPLSMLLLNRLVALIAILGLGGLISTMGVFQFTELGYLEISGAVGAGYVLAFLILAASGTLAEMALMIGLISALSAGMVMLGGEMFAEAAQMVLWSLTIGAGYSPMLLIALGHWEAEESRQRAN